MKRLDVLYDARCAFCRACRDWAERQATFVPLRFLAQQAEPTRRRYPELQLDDAAEELIVVSSDGRVYREAKAFVLVLWAMRRYRGLANRLAGPRMLPLARRAFGVVSRARHALPGLALPGGVEQLEERLRVEPEPPRCVAAHEARP